MRTLNESIIQRFMSKVWITTDKECWQWLGSLDGKGYGQFQAFGRQGGKHGRMSRAHRISYQIKYGLIPNGLFVLHKCDNPKCVNPDHLFLGTQKDNINDMHIKGRGYRPPLTTHCPKGHEYTPDNTAYWKRISGNPSKICKLCSRERHRIKRLKLRSTKNNHNDSKAD